MAEEKGLGKFLVYCGLISVLFLVMIKVVFSFGGKIIRAEILILLFLVLLSLIGFIGYRKSWGERVLFFVFLIGLGNLVFVWYFTGRLFILHLFLVLVGFLMSFPKKEEEWEFREEKKILGEKKEPFDEVLEGKEIKKEESESEDKKEVKTKYSPGKYVGSKSGSVYHEPKCEWAKRIVKGRRVWFEGKKEAKEKGYKEHNCVE